MKSSLALFTAKQQKPATNRTRNGAKHFSLSGMKRPQYSATAAASFKPEVLIGDALASALRALPHDRLHPIAKALEKR